MKLTRHLSNEWQRYAGANTTCQRVSRITWHVRWALQEEGEIRFSFLPLCLISFHLLPPSSSISLLTTTWSWNNARIRVVLLRQVNVHLICNAPSKPRVQVFVFQCVHRIHHDGLNLVPTHKNPKGWPGEGRKVLRTEFRRHIIRTWFPCE